MPTRVLQGALVVAPAIPALSKLDFRWRLSIEEQVALKRAETEHANADTRAALIVMRESLAEVTDAAGVDVTDPRTIGGAELVVSVLIDAGLIAPADAPARLATLLAPAT